MVYVTTPGSTGGGEARSYQVARALARQGHEVHLYAREHPAGLHEPDLRRHGLPPFPLSLPYIAASFRRHGILILPIISPIPGNSWQKHSRNFPPSNFHLNGWLLELLLFVKIMDTLLKMQNIL